MFNTVKFMRPMPYAISTTMTAIVDGIPQASFVMSRVVGSEDKLPPTIDHKKALELGFHKIDLIEYKPLTKEALCQ